MVIKQVTISDSDYHNILTAIGYPALSEEDIYSIITKDQIMELILEPSLEDFYKFFPKKIPIDVSVAGSGAISEYNVGDTTGIVLGVLQAKFIPQSSSVPGQSLMDVGSFYQNPFFSASQVLGINGSAYGIGNSYGTPYGYGQETIIYLKRFLTSSIESSNKVYWYKYDPNTNILSYKSNISGKFYFELGMTDSNIDNIQFTKKRSFIDYCKGKLKLQIAETLSLIELDLPASLNQDALKDQGDKLIDDNLTYWRESSSFFGMR